MRVAVIGRTRALLEAATRVAALGHEIPLVWTCRAEPFYGAREADFEALAGRLGATFVDDAAINSETSIARLAAAGCDVAISVNWLSVLGPAVLARFPLGVLNAHAGDLPRFRGNACPNWAILAGEPRIGLCIHEMVAEIDAGPVYLRDYLPLDEVTYIGDVYKWLEARIPAMLAQVVEELARGTAKAEPQGADPSAALRTYPRRPEDARIDWHSPAEAILRLVRASSRPFDGAYTTLEGKEKVTVWRAQRAQHPERFLAVPGQVCYRAGDDPVIACGDGVVQLTEVSVEGCGGSPEGKRRIAASLRHRLV